MTTKDRLKKIIVEHLGVTEDRVSDDANLFMDLGADSLDAIELVMAVEEEFNIEVPDTSFEDWMQVTFGEAAERLKVAVIETA